MTKKEMKRREQLKLDIISLIKFQESRYPGIYYSKDKKERIKFAKNKIKWEYKCIDRWNIKISKYYKDVINPFEFFKC